MGVADENLILRTSAAGTSSVTGSGVDFSGADLLPTVYRLTVSAASGTSPTLDVKIQDSDNNSTWADLAHFNQMTAVGMDFITVRSNRRYRRYNATIAGTSPSFTFQIDAVPGGHYDNF